MKQVFISILSIPFIFIGCKSTKTNTEKAPAPITPFKIVVQYSYDSVWVKPKPIQVSSEGFGGKDSTVDFRPLYTENNDSMLFVTISSYNGCQQMEFELYQNPIVIKTYPPRYRMRLSKSSQKGCDEPRTAMYTAAFDIRSILKEYPEAFLMIDGLEKPATIKRQVAK